MDNNCDPNSIRLQTQSTQDEKDIHHDNKSPSFHAKGKPRVVVPSPKGIPRPEPISTITDTGKRSSIISTDSMSDEEFFLYDMDRKPRTQSIEESEEFRQAVDSFEEIYRSESGHQIVERKSEKSTIRKIRNEDGGSRTNSECTQSFDVIEAAQVKNVDGAAKERKGSNKVMRKRQSRPSSS